MKHRQRHRASVLGTFMALMLVMAAGAAPSSVIAQDSRGAGPAGGANCQGVQVRQQVEYDATHQTRVGIARVNQDCTVSKKVVDLDIGEYRVYQLTGQLPGDAFERADVSGSFKHTQLPGGVAPQVLPLGGGGGKSVAGKLRTCHRVSPFNCVGEVDVQAGFFFQWWDGSITAYNSAWATRWTGNCWYTTWGPSTYWDTSGYPTAVGYVHTSGFDVVLACPDLGYGGSLSVEPVGVGNGDTVVYCWADFTGPWPTEYQCSKTQG